MARKATIELEDGRIISGEVQSGVNLGGPLDGPRWEIELKLSNGDVFLWKQAADGGSLLHME